MLLLLLLLLLLFVVLIFFSLMIGLLTLFSAITFLALADFFNVGKINFSMHSKASPRTIASSSISKPATAGITFVAISIGESKGNPWRKRFKPDRLQGVNVSDKARATAGPHIFDLSVSGNLGQSGPDNISTALSLKTPSTSPCNRANCLRTSFPKVLGLNFAQRHSKAFTAASRIAGIG